MSDGYIQVATDGDGKKVDTTDLTREDGTEVHRTRIVLGSNNDTQAFAEIVPSGFLRVMVKNQDEIVRQLKRIALILELMSGHSVSVNHVSE